MNIRQGHFDGFEKIKIVFVPGTVLMLSKRHRFVGHAIFSIAMFTFCKLKKTPLITVIIHEAHVGLIVNTINNTDLNVIETVFHDIIQFVASFKRNLET